MYKKILVPLDGSEFSERILDHVRAIAIGCHIPEVILLRVEHSLGTADVYMAGQSYDKGAEWGGDTKKKVEATATEYLSKVAADLKQEGIAADTVVIWGEPAEGIVDYIRNNQVDLVIMSTHGRSGASRWFFGSVAEKVLRHSLAPVLIAAPTAFRE